MDANEKVLDVLKNAGKALKSAEIAEASGLDPKEVSKAIKALKESGLVSSPKNCFYAAN